MIRKLITLLFCISFFTLFLSSDNLIKNIRSLIIKKEYKKAVKLVDEALMKKPGSNILKRMKIDILLESGAENKALGFIDRELNKHSNDRFLMSENIRVSLICSNFNRALEAALVYDKSLNKKNPASSFMIARIYLKQLAPDDAMVWLNESLERGFIDYMIMRPNEFKLLHKRADFLELIGKMKLSAGVGNPAKPFTINVMKEKASVSLSHYKGKTVVLIFTGSWSKVSYEEVQNLRKNHDALKKKGIVIIEINLDTKMRYVEKQKRPWIMVASLKGLNDPIALLYNVKSVPSLWVIGKKGYVRSFGLRGEELLEVLHKLSAE